MKIAYQGEPGAFSEAAARQVEPDAQLLPCEELRGRLRRGRRPTRPTTASCRSRTRLAAASTATSTCCSSHELPIVGEVELPVVHHLLALPGATLERLRRVYSHPQALAQCERFLRTLTGVEIIATYDTAGSAKMIADAGLTDAAAIASARAGEVFGLDVARRVDSGLRRQHHPLPGHRPPAASRRASPDKTSIVFTLPNEPGALFKALSVFALRGIDLTKLESRPIPGRQVGVPVLRRPGRGARRGDLRARAGAPRRVRADAAHARLVPQLEDRSEAAHAADSFRDACRDATGSESADHRAAAARRRARC